jgi:PAS domain S-box-containing protein
MDALGNINVLLVEDQAVIAMGEAMLLKKNGYTVTTAMTGQAAINEVMKRRDIDLILMDLDLGEGIDGAQTAQIINTTSNVPVLFLSGHTEREIVEKTEGISCSGYVVKNSGDTVLLASMKMALRLHEARMQLQQKSEALEIANRELVQREKEYRSLLETGPVAVGILHNRCFVMVNEILCSTFGYTKAELLGNTTRMLYENDEEFQRLGKLLYTEIKERGESVQETWLRRKDGSAVNVKICARPLDPDSPDPAATVSTTLLVIPVEHTIMQELRDLQAKIEEQDKIINNLNERLNTKR